MTGLVVLLVAVAAALAIALLMRWKNGRFTATAVPVSPPASGRGEYPPTDARERLTAEQIGVPLGERATLVQFSSAFCSPCRATRVVLADVASKVPGVVTVDIDAEEHLQLVRDLDIMRTPTVLVLDAEGAVTTRASGQPRRDQVLAALDRTIAPER
ncbi:MAG: thioredoxin family protein [Aeromicrobium sp.]